jgi:hypothetical protein
MANLRTRILSAETRSLSAEIRMRWIRRAGQARARVFAINNEENLCNLTTFLAMLVGDSQLEGSKRKRLHTTPQVIIVSTPAKRWFEKTWVCRVRSLAEP